MSIVAFIKSFQMQAKPIYFTLLGVLFFTLIILYMYFLSMSVVHVVLRKEINRSVAETSSQIATLEASYIESQHKVSDKIAALDTFTETNSKIFVTRGPNASVLTDARR
jgi:hypothetical protein